MKKAVLYVGLTILFLVSTFAQDQNLGYNKIYPASAFIQNGGNIVDVTQPPFNATGDGVTDDSDALIAAFNFVADSLAYYDYDAPEASYIIYIPNGTYKVSKTIHYTIDLPQNSDGKDFLAQLRIYGQSRENTIIKLIDNCPGFETGTSKPVISTVNSPENQNQNNWASNNGIKNLTVNIGSGNPGAVGIRFNGANNCRAENLKLISEDGQGYIGYHIYVRPTQGYHSNIIVEGFDYGVAVATGMQHVTHPTFEYLTVSNQNIAGFWLQYSSSTVRKLQSTNAVPGVLISEASAHLVIIDSDLNGGNVANPAIDFSTGHLFARNITTSGYSAAIMQGDSTIISEANIVEYHNHNTLKFDVNTPNQSINLPIDEVPVLDWETNFDNWAVVDDYGAVGDGFTDDTDAIQAALNSGKPMIYFPKQEYDFTEVNVPASVKRINVGFARLYTNGGFVVNETSADPLFIEDINNRAAGGVIVNHASTRTIVLDHCQSQGKPYIVSNSDPNKKAFMLDVTGFGKADNPITNVNLFARWINTENANNPNFLFSNGCIANILGYKIEKRYVNTLTENGAILEILGGVSNYTSTGDALNDMHQIKDGHVSIVSCTNMPTGTEVVENAIVDQQGEKINIVKFDSLPERGGDPAYIQGSTNANKILPLYVSYDPGAIPGGNPLPAVNITSPLGEDILLKDTDVTITADASDENGSVVKVEFFANDNKLGEDMESPWSILWSNITAGSYNLVAKATDNEGATRFSDLLIIEVLDSITHVSSLTIDNCPQNALTESKTLQLQATILPINATYNTVLWSSDNETVATVSETGFVTANSEGIAIITATSENGEYSDNCKIRVLKGDTITVDIQNPGYELGDFTGWVPNGTYNIASANKYEGAYAARCRSNGSSIEQTFDILPNSTYTVSVYAKKTGAAFLGVKGIESPVEIEITSTEWQLHTFDFNTGPDDTSATIYTRSDEVRQYAYVDSWMVTTIIAIDTTTYVDSVEIDNCPSEELSEGDEMQLTAIVFPSDADNKSISWTSSDEAVATINDTGLITAVGAGNATITVTSSDGGFIDNCNIVVTKVTETTNYHTTNVLAYPNPAHSNDQISITGLVQNSTVKIFDIKGNLVFKVFELNENKINIPKNTFTNGLFLINIINSNGDMQIGKIIVH